MPWCRLLANKANVGHGIAVTFKSEGKEEGQLDNNIRKMSALMSMDILLTGVSVLWGFALHCRFVWTNELVRQCLSFALLAMAVSIISLHSFKLYRRVWVYASIQELVSILKAVSCTTIVSVLLWNLIWAPVLPLSFVITIFETMLLTVGGTRFALRMLRKYPFAVGRRSSVAVTQRALIVGAGSCGSVIASEMLNRPDEHIVPVAFVDDDAAKHRYKVHGVSIIGNRHAIPELVRSLSVDSIIIAAPSAPRRDIKDIIDICKQTKARLRTVPSIHDLIQGKVTLNEIRDVGVEDLLGREPVRKNLDEIASYLHNRTVLITGAGGSIGAELCRQAASLAPNRLILLGHGENSIYQIEMELRHNYPALLMETIIADIQDRDKIESVFACYRPNVVFHAAAHKHVPLMERNPAEAVKNNVFGTKNVAECADCYDVDYFMLISTDKAVNPTSVMGATKRVAEMIVQSMSVTSKTVFTSVRLGNVLGSRGSVIPRFKQQIMTGGPVTVTHPEMIRYFMTIPEAVQLVIQAGSLAKGGEVFILDMGKPTKIAELAKDLIRLSGLEPDVDISIEYTGIRPGEKLYEELLTAEEGLTSTKHDRIFIGRPAIHSRVMLEANLSRLSLVLTDEADHIRSVLKQLVPSYVQCIPIESAAHPSNLSDEEKYEEIPWSEGQLTLV